MAAGYQYTVQRAAEFCKELRQSRELRACQHSEARQRLTSSTIERRRYTPHTASPGAQLAMIARRIFDETVWRISHYRMD